MMPVPPGQRKHRDQKDWGCGLFRTLLGGVSEEVRLVGSFCSCDAPFRATFCTLNPSLSNRLRLFFLLRLSFLSNYVGTWGSNLDIFCFCFPHQWLSSGVMESWVLRLPIGSLKLPCVSLGPLLQLEGWLLLLVRGLSQGTLWLQTPLLVIGLLLGYLHTVLWGLSRSSGFFFFWGGGRRRQGFSV